MKSLLKVLIVGTVGGCGLALLPPENALQLFALGVLFVCWKIAKGECT